MSLANKKLKKHQNNSLPPPPPLLHDLQQFGFMYAGFFVHSPVCAQNAQLRFLSVQLVVGFTVVGLVVGFPLHDLQQLSFTYLFVLQ